MSRPLRIAMISQYLPGGSKIGVGHQAHALAQALVDRGHEVTVWSACPAGEGARYSTVVVSLTGRLRTFRFASALRTVDFGGFDVLHAHGDDYWLWRRRVPAHVRTVHGSCFDEALHISGAGARLRMAMLGFSELLASVVADRTVVVSPSTRRWLPWVRDVVPNGIDNAVFSPDPHVRAAQPTILFVGTYERRKRGRLLMETFAREVRPLVPGARLEMVCTDAPSAPGVSVLGRVSEAELVAAYRRAWVFCLPSSYEGFGIPYAEAMACGTAVAATRNAGANYVLDRGEAGALVADDGLGPALVELLRDGPRRETLAAAGLSRSREFAMDAVVDRYEAIYREAIDHRTGSR